MRLLVFSDLHRDKVGARSIVDRAEDVDVVVGAGDFAVARVIGVLPTVVAGRVNCEVLSLAAPLLLE